MKMNRELFIDVEGPPGLFAVFEEDAERGGYQYLYQPDGAGIIRHLKIYDLTLRPLPDEDEIEVMWSSDQKKCGVAIWGRMRGVMDVVHGEDMSILLENKQSPAIVAPEWLTGFDSYLDQKKFIASRKRYWKDMARRYKEEHQSDSASVSNGEGSTEDAEFSTNFVAYSQGPHRLFAVFEDDARVGHLYLYDLEDDNVVQDLQVYICSQQLQIRRRDVRLAWSKDGDKCGVIIWDKMRGIIDRAKKREGRVKLEDRNTPGIIDHQWLKGFEYLYS
jgi:hypothetical protein